MKWLLSHFFQGKHLAHAGMWTQMSYVSNQSAGLTVSLETSSFKQPFICLRLQNQRCENKENHFFTDRGFRSCWRHKNDVKETYLNPCSKIHAVYANCDVSPFWNTHLSRDLQCLLQLSFLFLLLGYYKQSNNVNINHSSLFSISIILSFMETETHQWNKEALACQTITLSQISGKS